MIYFDEEKVALTEKDFNVKSLNPESADYLVRDDQDRPSLPKGGMAAFLRLRMPEYSYDNAGNRMIIYAPRAFLFEPKFNMYVEGKGDVVVQYGKSFSKQNKKGIMRMAPDPDMVEFPESCRILVDTKRDRDLWWFLLNHPYNIESPHRRPNDRREFMLYQHDKYMSIETKELVAAGKATTIILEKMPLELVRKAAIDYVVPSAAALAESPLRLSLVKTLQRKKKFAEFISIFKKEITELAEKAPEPQFNESFEPSKAAVLISDAKAVNALRYNATNREWQTRNVGNNKWSELVVKVGPSADADNVLVEYLNRDQEGRDELKEIVEVYQRRAREVE